MWPFKRKHLLDADTAAWHLENFEWLVRCWAPGGSFAASRLVLPQAAFFPVQGETGHALAELLLRHVQDHAHMADWPMVLQPGPDGIKRGYSLAEVAPTREVLGTFSFDETGARVLTYAPHLLADPPSLIATLAHEVAHALLHSAPHERVCEPDEEEFLTDLTAVYLGFGVFMANNVFSFGQFRADGIGTQGWSSERRGYLPEADLVFALALFIALKQIDPAPARAALKPHLAGQLDHALKDLKDYEPQIERIRALEHAAI